ncbi:hypothetical protein [Actinoplanes sp. NPDC051411]|jgi:hypothetical protein|uniref:hypothetical protein n=1 Tax=Actinoplanes sp. NPDC051411 TaxID=3155522 RepID=UPI0034427587
MAADDMWTAFDAALRELEAEFEERGWNQPPALYGIFDRPAGDADTRVLVWRQMLDREDIWGSEHPAAILTRVARSWTGRDAAGRFRTAMNRNGRVPVAFVFVSEVWGDTHQRMTVAVDLRGDRHILVRTRGQDRPRRMPPASMGGQVPEALARLIGAATER